MKRRPTSDRESPCSSFNARTASARSALLDGYRAPATGLEGWRQQPFADPGPQCARFDSGAFAELFESEAVFDHDRDIGIVKRHFNMSQCRNFAFFGFFQGFPFRCLPAKPGRSLDSSPFPSVSLRDCSAAGQSFWLSGNGRVFARDAWAFRIDSSRRRMNGSGEHGLEFAYQADDGHCL